VFLVDKYIAGGRGKPAPAQLGEEALGGLTRPQRFLEQAEHLGMDAPPICLCRCADALVKIGGKSQAKPLLLIAHRALRLMLRWR